MPHTIEGMISLLEHDIDLSHVTPEALHKQPVRKAANSCQIIIALFSHLLLTTPVSEEKGTCYHFIDRHHGK